MDLIRAETVRAKSTCEWIFSVPPFLTWSNGLKPLLWISAGFGCGKTTLMSFLKQRLSGQDGAFDHIENRPTSVPTVCGFFFNHKFQDLANATVLLRCLIWDLITQRHDMIHHVLEHYQESRPWSYTQLWQTFNAILRDPEASSLCIIIDALDQCNEVDTVMLLEGLIEILEERSVQSNDAIRFIISSRPALAGPVKEVQMHASNLLLDQDAVLRGHTTTDIRRFVLQSLDRDGRLFPSDVPNRVRKIETLADSFTLRSEGNFLWAKLVFEQLRKRSYVKLSDVDKFLSECPKDIEGIYCKALANVDPLYHEAVLKSFHIILAANRPLTIAEFKGALAIEENHQTLESWERTIEDLEHITSYLEQILGPLLWVTKTGISLRHQAVKDFLLSRIPSPKALGRHSHLKRCEGDCEIFVTSMSESQKTLTKCCINLLRLNDFDQEIGPQNDNMEIWESFGFMPMNPSTVDSQSYDDQTEPPESCPPFFEYAASNWPSHFASIGSIDDDVVDAVRRLLKQTNNLAHWSHQFRRHHQGDANLPDHLDASIVAAYFGHAPVISSLMKNHDRNLMWKTALTWASRMGQGEIVKLILGFGIPYDGSSVDGRSSFSWAVAGGHLEIVDMLLERDMELINVKDADGCCPLMLAAANGELEMVEKLIHSEDIDVNLRGNRGASAIHCAINGPNPPTVELDVFRRLLDDLRLDITLRDAEGRTCLSYLAQYDVTEAIQALLDCSDRQDAVRVLLDDEGDKRGFSPLSYAVRWSDNASTVRILCKTNKIQSQLESVCEPDNENVFVLAARNGHVNAIRELGRYYPEGVNCRDKSGRTALSTAMWGSNPDVLRALLDCGADVDLPDKEGKAAVAYGIRKIEMVKVLAEHGADMNFRDSDGHTPLWWAEAINADEQTLALLKDLGAHL